MANFLVLGSQLGLSSLLQVLYHGGTPAVTQSCLLLVPSSPGTLWGEPQEALPALFALSVYEVAAAALIPPRAHSALDSTDEQHQQRAGHEDCCTPCCLL